MTHSMMGRRVLGCGRVTLRLRAWEALRAWGARVLLPQLRILATNLAAIKEEEKMFQTPTAGHLANVTEHVT